MKPTQKFVGQVAVFGGIIEVAILTYAAIFAYFGSWHEAFGYFALTNIAMIAIGLIVAAGRRFNLL